MPVPGIPPFADTVVIKKMIRRALIEHGIPPAPVEVHSGFVAHPPYYEEYYGWLQRWYPKERADMIAKVLEEVFAPLGGKSMTYYSDVYKDYMVGFSVPAPKIKEYIRRQSLAKALLL
jgi:hypothetical protein